MDRELLHHAVNGGGQLLKPCLLLRQAIVEAVGAQLVKLADEHHHRQAGANRARQHRHHLGHARAARDGGNGELAGSHDKPWRDT
jgi:hypothetical protein